MRRWEAWINHLGWGLTATSGLLYGFWKYFAPASDPNSPMASPWQPTVLAAHLLAAWVAVFALGLLFRRHVLARLLAQEREGRRSGSLMAWLAIPLASSGYLIQALTGVAARRWTGWFHAGAGLLFGLAYATHPRRSRSLPEDAAKAASEANDHGV
jgi:hypothetical protein